MISNASTTFAQCESRPYYLCNPSENIFGEKMVCSDVKDQFLCFLLRNLSSWLIDLICAKTKQRTYQN